MWNRDHIETAIELSVDNGPPERALLTSNLVMKDLLHNEPIMMKTIVSSSYSISSPDSSNVSHVVMTKSRYDDLALMDFLAEPQKSL